MHCHRDPLVAQHFEAAPAVPCCRRARSRDFAHVDIEVAAQLLEGGLDLIDPRRMIETEQPIHLLPMPAEPARELPGIHEFRLFPHIC
jgi:hypothetical protein